ncbi:hypothetical protein DFH29DRAFT_1008613 [Suillus ampliporus]|nr:hypothetical protein DFH29DRAFT_1008613 [Suillus ampliporus]
MSPPSPYRNNLVNTFETRLVLRGFLRRVNKNAKGKWNVNDKILWQGLDTIADIEKYKDLWLWVVHGITKKEREIEDVLHDAGEWWRLQPGNDAQGSKGKGKKRDEPMDTEMDGYGSKAKDSNAVGKNKGKGKGKGKGKEREEPMDTDADGEGSPEYSGGRDASMPAAPLPPTIPVGDSTSNEAAGDGPGPGDGAALPPHVPVENGAADRAAGGGHVSGTPAPTQGPLGEDGDSGDGSAHPGPPSPSAPTPPAVPIDHGGDASESTHAPPPPEMLAGAGSSASSRLQTSQKILDEHRPVYHALGQYVSNGLPLEGYATILRNAFPDPEYEEAISGYLQNLSARPLDAFNPILFKPHMDTFISQLTAIAARFEAHEQQHALL